MNVMKWFIERAQLVIVFFDPQKLDFSTEFKQVLLICNENKSKLMFALNKIDSVDNADMIRMYGSIMYLLGKCVNIPEPPNMRLVSFQSNPLNRNSNMHSFFKQNEREMLDIIQNLPKSHNRDRLVR
ncbi:PREDICTED: EH domain-containing protein 3-like, partial [Rhagoletis zephyria]|uniref:EH domain-containing protein 3-like n=1 Tax=Rhagoletis zephyria TaxID=28612 RepID=UPI00081195CE